MRTPHIPQNDTAEKKDNNFSHLPEIMTVYEVAKLLRVNIKTIYDAAKRGEIPCQKIGRVYRFNKAFVIRWLNGQGCLSLDAGRKK